MRILQLSDPHLVAADTALVRERPALELLERALLEGQSVRPDLLLTAVISARTRAGAVTSACDDCWRPMSMFWWGCCPATTIIRCC